MGDAGARRPLDATTIPEAFARVVALYADQTALRTIDESVSYTWRELSQRVRSVAAGLAGLGVNKADTVALLLPNTVDTHIIDYAAYHVGAVPFAIFNTSAPEQIEHQLRDAGTRIVFTDSSFLDRLRPALDALAGQVTHLVVLDEAVEGALSLPDVESAAPHDLDLDAIGRQLTADDLATLIYTSGTTGAPKGALWSHRTVLAAQRGLDAALPIPRISVISFLPLAHAGGRISALYMALAHGAAITACPDMSQLPLALATHRPDSIFSVPRVWEKLQVAIEGLIAAEPDNATREALQSAVEAGKKYVLAAESGSGASDAEIAQLRDAYDHGVQTLKPVIARLGLDRVKSAFVGGAPSAPEVSIFFRAVGVPMLEAYGGTEVSLNIFNRVDRFKTGTAGFPLPGVEIRVADDGELLCRADMNFVGYRNLPEMTRATLDDDGWLHTGDIVEVDEDGFVTVVDRKKEIIINSAGKNMSPALIESTIKGESSLIAQIVAVGDRKRYVTALVTLDPEALTTLAAQIGLDDSVLDELIDRPEVHQLIEAAVERGNRRLNRNEQVKKFRIISVAWPPDSEELTPTLKLKRRVIHGKYAEQIDALYED